MIVLNERLWAEQILETGDLGSNQGAAIQVLARYYYWVEGLKRKAIIAKLHKLLAQLIPDYNPVRWEEFLDRSAVHAKKRQLIELDGVPVHTGELAFIEALPSVRLRRLAFTMVVVARYFNSIHAHNNNWVNLEVKEVFSLACVAATLSEQASMYRELIDAGFMEYSKKVGNNNARVLILDETETALVVPDLRMIGHEYQLYCGEPYIRCARCGVLTRQNTNQTKKYCAECAKHNVMTMRKFNCIDCGAEVFVVTRANASCRCPDCQKIATKLKYQRYHAKLKTKSATAQTEDE